MTRDGDELARRLESFRNYLMLLARARLDERLQGRLAPADLVQQTLVRAFERRDQFHGDNDARRAAWLRTLMDHTLIDAVRRLGRSAGWERSLEAALEQSSARMEAFLAADETSVGARAERNEWLVRLADALARLPDDQRRAVELRHLQGLSLGAVADRMGRSVASVAGLLHRGLRALRNDLGESRGV
jgi:RNA polymerase sigma-70 factor (ECF subfamily)